MNDHVVTDKVFLFTDLHNFSIVMTTLENRAAEMLQAYYVFAGEILTKAGGKILKYMGDSVFAIFDSGKELDAVASGIELKAAFLDFANGFGVGDVTDMEVGIGSGSCVYGTYGHPSLLVTDVCGDAVNEAAVIMHHRGVAITRPVYEAVKNSIRCEKLSDFQPKWRDMPLERWEAVSSPGGNL